MQSGNLRLGKALQGVSSLPPSPLRCRRVEKPDLIGVLVINLALGRLDKIACSRLAVV
jgi:hypothetical protein